MSDLSFDPHLAENGRNEILKRLVQLLNDVERPLRRMWLPEMPASLRSSVSSQIDCAIATMSTARVELAGLAAQLRALAEVMQAIERGETIEFIERLMNAPRFVLGPMGAGSQLLGLHESTKAAYLARLTEANKIADQLLELSRDPNASAAQIGALQNRLDQLKNPSPLDPESVAKYDAALKKLELARADPRSSPAYISALENELADMSLKPTATGLHTGAGAQKTLWDRYVKYFPNFKIPPKALTALKVVDGVMVPLNLYFLYQGSSAQSWQAQSVSAAAGTAATFTPPGAVLDVATGGALASGIDGMVTVVSDGSFVGPGMESWNQQNLNGDNGWVLHSYAQAGDLATPATTSVLNAVGGENWPFTDDDGTVDWVPFN